MCPLRERNYLAFPWYFLGGSWSLEGIMKFVCCASNSSRFMWNMDNAPEQPRCHDLMTYRTREILSPSNMNTDFR
jgi:hypothetical protein